MSHTYAQNVVHVVFSTRERRNSIAKDSLPRLWSYAAGICKNERIFVYAIGGTENHIHLLLQIPPVLALAKAVYSIKANSSRWLNETGHRFDWQEGYAAFSVSKSMVETVERYVRNQEAHHRKICFEDEFQALLEKHGISYDPKYMLG